LQPISFSPEDLTSPRTSLDGIQLVGTLRRAFNHHRDVNHSRSWLRTHQLYVSTSLVKPNPACLTCLSIRTCLPLRTWAGRKLHVLGRYCYWHMQPIYISSPMGYEDARQVCVHVRLLSN